MGCNTSNPTSSSESGSINTSSEDISSSIVNTSSQESTETSSETSSSSSVTSEDEEEEGTKIKYITLTDREIFVEVGKRHSSLIVNFYVYDGVELTLDDKDVTWSIEDTSVAEIDQYGRVTGKSAGRTIAKCVTRVDNRHATCSVRVVNSMDDIVKRYNKVTDYSSLESGDLVVLAHADSGKTAGNDDTGMHLNSVDSSFSNDKSYVSNLGSGTATFMLEEKIIDGYRFFSLENEYGQYLSAKNEKKIQFVNNKGNIYFHFMDDDGCYMESSSNVPGWMMYNAKSDWFTLYESNPQIDLFLIDLYRLEIID